MYVCINLQCQYVLGECACTHQRKNHLRRIRRVDNVSMSLESLHALTSGKTICREYGRVDNVSMSKLYCSSQNCGCLTKLGIYSVNWIICKIACNNKAAKSCVLTPCIWRLCMHSPMEKPSAGKKSKFYFSSQICGCLTELLLQPCFTSAQDS